MPDRTEVIPPMWPGDLYVYAHDNGAIHVQYCTTPQDLGDIVPLEETLSIVRDVREHGGRVFLAADRGRLAGHVVAQVRGLGLDVIDFEPSRPPNQWNDGTTALMESAHNGRQQVLEDLLARGADPDQRDRSGGTALHHAAARGNVAAIDALADAGADLEASTRAGMTPHQTALVARQEPAARRLAAHGARTDGGTDVRFRRYHLVSMIYPLGIWLFAAITLGVMIAAGAPGGAVAVLALILLAQSVVAPPRAYWAGGVPRSLEGTVLTLRGYTLRVKKVDLARATYAALSGNPPFNRGLTLVIGHPDGVPLRPKSVTRRLHIREAEVPELLKSADRFLVVPISGGALDEVLVPVGNLLTSRKVAMSPTMRRTLNAERWRTAMKPRPWWRRI